MEYGFDEMKNLYIDDPKEFERVAVLRIEEAINAAHPDHQDALRAQNWRLHQELDKIVDPVERMNQMVPIFWAGVKKFASVVKNPVIDNKNVSQVIDIKEKHKN